MTWSTCTYNPSENEVMVSFILKEYPYMKLADVNSKFGKYGMANAGLTEEERVMVRRFDSSGRDDFVCESGVERDADCVGFFCAKFVKDF